MRIVSRALDKEATLDELWEDLTSNIIIQERPEWVEVTRTNFEVNCREVPDDEDCKALPRGDLVPFINALRTVTEIYSFYSIYKVIARLT